MVSYLLMPSSSYWSRAQLLVEYEVNNMPGVTSSPKVRVRRTAEDRRAEIVAAATRLALADGLGQVTLRSVAVELGITGGLVSHYFPSVDGLLAEAFGAAVGSECDETFAELDAIDSPADRLGPLMERLVDSTRGDVSALWIDAWHAAKRRPALNEEVVRQTERWVERLADLLEQGRAAGQFHTDDPRSSAVRIMAMVDGLSVQVTQRGTIDYESVARLVFLVAEIELGLPRGALV
jgi:AcrR family transcriptional regulator